MKLWQKVSLICSAVLTSIVLLMGGLLLREAEQSILDLTYQQSSDKQRNLSASFSEMSNYYLEDSDTKPVEYSLVKYCFSRFADSTCVLMKGSETMYSNVAVDMSRYIIKGYDAEQFEEEIAYLVDGDASIVFEDEEFLLHQGDTVRILPSRKHKMRNDSVKPVQVLFIKSKVNF